ncbi:Protein-tyrosine-phosphatase MKP1 [Platanthera guangdongensis]|uniref:Protein-tyrosine-phosphatase MKP1 n=1 Tax=Platanthera guangdongensis TaxID=2320717 RepID=A0ABR2LCM6_9ASPA
MDGDDDTSTSSKALWRSASWSGRSSPALPGRPPKPSRPLQPLSVTRHGPITGWPCPASDDSGHPPPTPSTPSSAAADDELDCSRVENHVYLGSEAAARDRKALRRHGITHVLNCVGSACPEYFRGELVYKTLWLHDSPAEDISSVLYDAFDYLEDVRELRPPGRVLVHCRRGASRSAALVIAYLMWRHCQPFDEALRVVRAARASADPNLGFASQLLQCQARVLLSPSSSGLRAYRMAPHSIYDPLHLVAKSISCPALLDSRGAFLFHVPAAVFVWLGRSCNPAIADAVASAARQVVLYERARGPILTVKEGSEPSDFWGEHISRAGEVGNRRVELYDLDFEIFRRAQEGEIRPLLLLSSTSSEIDSTTAMQQANDEDDVGPSPSTPSSFSVETASTISTFSPASTSSSDGHNFSLSPSPVAELQRTLSPLNPSSKLPPLHPRKGKEKDASITMPSLSPASRRTGSSSSLRLLLPSEKTPSHAVLDWCLPPHESEMEECQEMADSDSARLGITEVEDASTSGFNCRSRPLVFQWPGMDKVEEVHCGALDSSSVFMLLSPVSSPCRSRSMSNVLYVARKEQQSSQTRHPA